MCKSRDSIHAVTTAAHRLELACNGVGSVCDVLLQDPSTLQHLPTTEASESLSDLLRQLDAIPAKKRN